jgi:hypothetical protein
MQTKDAIPTAQDPRLSSTVKDFPQKKNPKTVVILRKAK